MKMRWKKAALLFAAAFVLCGCAQKAGAGAETTEVEIDTEEAQKETSAQTVSEDSQAAESNVSTEEDSATTEADSALSADTPYAKHGALSVNGANLTDENGDNYRLYGMSTHGIAWFPQYVSYETFQTLRDDWNTNCVRLAMYTAENGGYCTDGDKESLKTLVKNGVDYATELGMYVIVDWHVLREENPLVYKDEAGSFFDELSKLYAGQDNILYEICNEPNGGATWENVKTYADAVIPVIRANDANAVILVGTPTWSQELDKAAASPLEYDNVMYTLHFYAATHTDWLRERAKTCIEQGLPVFVSEFGLCDASGNGAVDEAQAEEWKSFMDAYHLSYLCWNLSNKNEGSSVLSPDCAKTSGFTEADLSEQGKCVTEWFRGEK